MVVADILDVDTRRKGDTIVDALDPVRLLRQIETLQRRVKEWRARTIVTLNDEWLREDRLTGPTILPPLRLFPAGSTALA